MKKILENVSKNPYWVVLVPALGAVVNVKKLFEGIQLNTKPIMQVLFSEDGLNFWTSVILCIVVVVLTKRYIKLKKEISGVKKATYDGLIFLVKELVNDVYPKLIRLRYRQECLNGEKVYNYEEEKREVEKYLKEDKSGLTAQEMNEILNKHFSN